MSVKFYNDDYSFVLKGKRKYASFLQTQFQRNYNKLLELNVVFCSDERLLEINKQFLNHHYYTDIITFPLAESTIKVEAEIYISVERVKENAKEHEVSFADEMNRVIFHGVLHLCGYKDKSKQQQKEMRTMEDEWLKEWKTANS